MGISDWTTNELIEQLTLGSNKQRFQYYLDSPGKLLYLRAIQGHSGKQKVDPALQGLVVILEGSLSTSSTSAPPTTCILSFMQG